MNAYEDARREGQNLRDTLNAKYTKESKVNRKYDKGMRDYYNSTTGESFTKNESKYLDSTKGAGNFNDYIKRKSKDTTRESGKFTFGSGLHQGPGFGIGGSFKTSRKDDLASLVFDTPLVAKEATLNAMGIMTKQQKMQAASSGPLGKILGHAVPLTAMAAVGAGMFNGENPYDILQNQLVAASAFTGGIAGMRTGGVLSPVNKNGFIKGGSRLLGGAIGAAAGAGVAYGVLEGIKDITSAESRIGKFTDEGPKRAALASTFQNNNTLTMRQKSLQQISHSVLNDRGQTLGNEASILKNIGL